MTGLLVVLAVVAVIVIAAVVDRDREQECDRGEPRSVEEHAAELSPYVPTDERGWPL